MALLFALLLGAVVSVPLGDRWGLPAPVLMTLLGIVLAVLDFVPNVNIPPDLILPLLLPPLLYAAVRRTSWRQFTANKRMRGVASVALALAIPLQTDEGTAFPNRDEIVFIAFGVIMATLVLQGLTLPWLVKRLGVQADTDREKAFEKELAVRAAKRRLREIEAEEELPEQLSEQMVRRAFDIGLRISPDIGEDERREAHEQRMRRLKRVRRIQGEMLSAARHEVVAARSEPGVDPEIVDRVLRHLDVRSLR